MEEPLFRKVLTAPLSGLNEPCLLLEQEHQGEISITKKQKNKNKIKSENDNNNKLDDEQLKNFSK